MSGNKIIKGLKYGITCAVVWIVYLLEPLPHVNPIDKITYPMADSAALIVMGLLLGLFCSKDNPKVEHDRNRNILNDIFFSMLYNNLFFYWKAYSICVYRYLFIF